MGKNELRKDICREAMAGVAYWIEHRPMKREVANSIPSQDTCLGCRPGPQLGVCKIQQINACLTHIEVSLPPFPSF